LVRAQAETEAAAAAGKLSQKPGHFKQNKWIGRPGTVESRDLGRRKNHTHKMDIRTRKGAIEWLKSPNNAETKSNEPGRYGILAERLDEFNEFVQQITIGKAR
jgi:hypothetical protein